MEENKKIVEVFQKLGLSTEEERVNFGGGQDLEKKKRRNNYIILDNVSTEL